MLNVLSARPTSHLALNLVCTLKLDRVAASVARFDATSGEKINRMRKSYDNHLKQLGLAGKNKSTKDGDLGNAVGSRKMMSLSEMGGWPEEEWWNQKISGRDVHHGISEAVKSKLENAFHLNPGLVPDATMWEDILGIDRPTTSNPILRRDPKLAGQGVSKSASANTKANLESHHPGADQHPIRARRNTKKRRYDDGSFEGYGEGFLDDEMELEGYDSSETHTSRNSRGSKGEKNKRRKIQEPGRNHAQLGSRGSRTGSSTFGR